MPLLANGLPTDFYSVLCGFDSCRGRQLKYRQVEAEPNGWSEEIFPTMDGSYRMACCDCGLVHELVFSVVEVTRKFSDGSFASVPALKKYRVAFRAKRNERATAAMRRWRNKGR